MTLTKYILAASAAVAICATPVLGRNPVKVTLEDRVPSKVTIQWMGSAPDCKIVYDTIVSDLTDLGLEYVPYKDYWNFCLYVTSEVAMDQTSGTKWYAISIKAFNRLRFFSEYGGIPFSDHDAFVHRFHLFNGPESITVVSQADLQSEIKKTLDHFNSDVFSTVQSYKGQNP